MSLFEQLFDSLIGITLPVTGSAPGVFFGVLLAEGLGEGPRHWGSGGWENAPRPLRHGWIRPPSMPGHSSWGVELCFPLTELWGRAVRPQGAAAMRRHDDPIQVRLGRENEPAQFIWRDRLWRVLAVEVHWIESGAWWTGPAVRAARGQDAGEQGSTPPDGVPTADRYRFDDTLLRDSATGGRRAGSSTAGASPASRATVPTPAREWPGQAGTAPAPTCEGRTASVRGERTAYPAPAGEWGAASPPAGERSTVSALSREGGNTAGPARAGERGIDPARVGERRTGPARAGERRTGPARAGERGTVSARAGERGTVSASAGERTTGPAQAGEWSSTATTSRASVGASAASLRELGEGGASLRELGESGASLRELGEDPDLLCETEVWRVEAANGMAGSRGIYELAHLVHSGQWQLRGVMD